MNRAARELVDALGLAPLPAEGGYFRSTWRSESASAIYFLLTAEEFSALHRIGQDEIWHFYAGDPVAHVQLDPATGGVSLARLGPDVPGGDQPQVVVPAGVWQGAHLVAGSESLKHGFALLGCTVSPPWDERSFALGDRDELTRAFPTQAALIRALTR